MRSRRASNPALQPNQLSLATKEVLENAQWTFGPTKGVDVWELRFTSCNTSGHYSRESQCTCHWASHT